MAQYAVMHISKCGGSATGIGKHIDRESDPKNADKERRHLNQELIQRRSSNLNNDIKARIAEGYTQPKAIRKDAVKALTIVLTGSHDQMKEIERDPKLFQEWKQQNYDFIANKFGRDNIVRLTLHRDELTPHIHAVVVPITKDGRLSAKAFIDGPKELAELQTQYANQMKGFELERGRLNSVVKHTSVKEYYAKVNAQERAFPDLSISSKGIFENTEDYMRKVRKELAPVIGVADKWRIENMQLRAEQNRILMQAREEIMKSKEKIYNDFSTKLYLTTGIRVDKQSGQWQMPAKLGDPYAEMDKRRAEQNQNQNKGFQR